MCPLSVPGPLHQRHSCSLDLRLCLEQAVVQPGKQLLPLLACEHKRPRKTPLPLLGGEISPELSRSDQISWIVPVGAGMFSSEFCQSPLGPGHLSLALFSPLLPADSCGSCRSSGARQDSPELCGYQAGHKHFSALCFLCWIRAAGSQQGLEML